MKSSIRFSDPEASKLASTELVTPALRDIGAVHRLLSKNDVPEIFEDPAACIIIQFSVQ